MEKTRVQDRVTTVVGSIDDRWDFPDNTFRAVLCLGGALSHVMDAKRRRQAISELARVAKNKAPVFASVIGRLGAIVSQLVRQGFQGRR